MPSTRISDLKVGEKSVEDIRCLCSCVNQAQGSLLEVDTQWVRAIYKGVGVVNRHEGL